MPRSFTAARRFNGVQVRSVRQGSPGGEPGVACEQQDEEANAAEIVAMATPEQFRHFVDMSAWHGPDEGPRTVEVARWLRLAREGGEDDESFRRKLGSLDIELLALVLRRELRVHDLTEEEDA